MSFLTKLKDVFVSNVPDTSSPQKLDSTDLAKLIRDAAMVGGAAVVTFLSEQASSVDFGAKLSELLPMFTSTQWNMILVPIVASVLNTALKFFKGNTPTK